MPTFLLTRIDHQNAHELRLKTRADHLAYTGARRGMMKMAGPLVNDAGEMTGSMFVLEAPGRADVEAFAAADPYALAGLFERTEIRRVEIAYTAAV